jgi:hypothetical protein
MSSILFIKSSNVHTFQEVECNGDGCGYWINPTDHSMQGLPRLRMFKVNGVQYCEECIKETIRDLSQMLEFE